MMIRRVKVSVLAILSEYLKVKYDYVRKVSLDDAECAIEIEYYAESDIKDDVQELKDMIRRQATYKSDIFTNWRWCLSEKSLFDVIDKWLAEKLDK